MQKDLDKRRSAKPVVTAQMVPARDPAPQPFFSPRTEPVLTGIERAALEAPAIDRAPPPDSGFSPQVAERADNSQKPKTTMPRIAGGFKLPPSSLLHRPDG